MDRLITAGEVKNWFYCRRVVYYRRRMQDASQPTFKMEEALRAQDVVERLEARRTLQSYGVEGYSRRFNVWFTSRRYGITGQVDLLLVGAAETIPVDFKLTTGEPGENHQMQLALYGVLAEEEFGLAVSRAFLYRIPDDRLFEISLGVEAKANAIRAVEAISTLDKGDFLPEPTPVRARCTNCEYANFCADVW